MRVVVTGSKGQVGSELVALGAIGLDAVDVTDPDAVQHALTSTRADVVIHCAAYTDVDSCEADEERAEYVNALGVRNVCRAADTSDAFVVALSTDYVFDGTKAGPYVESDTPNPINAYGRTKRDGEHEVDLDRHAIVRTSWVNGVTGRNVVKAILRLLEEDAPLRFVNDQRGCPTFAADLALRLLDLADQRRTGIWHVTNQGAVTWYEFARDVVRAAGENPDRVEPITTAELARPARRPKNSALASERLHADELLPDYHEPLRALVNRLCS